MADFDPEQVENGSGKTTAVVYDTVADAVAWLGLQGLTALAGLGDAAQKAAMVRATRAAETALRAGFRGISTGSNQGLLFPALGAYAADGRLFDSAELPEHYRYGIFLLAEAVAAGRFMPHAAAAPGLLAESSRQGSITYARGTDFTSLGANHPEAWAEIRTAWPPL